MKHIKALAIKFISSLVLLYVILGMFYDMSFGNVFLITLVLGAVAYIFGDMLILSKTNNTIATIADFGLAFLLIWLMGESLTFGDSLIVPALLSAAGLALFEIFFHKYLVNNVFDSREDRFNQTGTLRYQTEASEELTPNEIKERNKE